MVQGTIHAEEVYEALRDLNSDKALDPDEFTFTLDWNIVRQGMLSMIAYFFDHSPLKKRERRDRD